MRFYIFSVVSLLLASQVLADDLDDLRASYIAQLQAIHDQALGTISSGEHNLDETDLYISHASETFITDGSKRIDNQIAVINDTASQLTLDAIMNNKPASVLTCISTRRHDGETALINREGPFQTKLIQLVADSTANFNQQRDTISLIKSQLDGLFIANSNKINTCVVQDCFDTNLNDAQTQYTNLRNSVDSIIADVKNARAKFNDQAITLVDNLRDDAQSDVDDANKKMGKC